MTPTTLQQKFMRGREEMAATLLERDEEIAVVLTALLCHENPLLVGAPGTAKSLLLDSVCEFINGTTRKFQVLLNKFSTPEELFGPISVQGLKQDQYRRVTTGYLPEADVAFVDEVWKASSAIINTLLRIMNEREFVNGDGVPRKVPLLMLMAASNEWPNAENGGQELSAAFDRFLFRKRVLPIRSPMNRQRLMWDENLRPVFSDHVTRDEVAQAAKEAATLEWTKDAKDTMGMILDELAKEGIHVGDRRQRKSIGACRAHAYLCGKDAVYAEDLVILAHVLWDDPTEQADKAAKVVVKHATPEAAATLQLLSAIDDAILKASNPVEAVPKLQAVKKELEKMKPGKHKDKAMKYVNESLTELMNKVLDINA